MKNGRLLVFVLVVFLLLVFVGSVVAIVVMLRGGTGPDLGDETALEIHLGGPMPDQPAPEQPLPGLGSQSLSVFEVDTALKRAAADDGISQLLIIIQPLGIGYGKIAELKDIIERFSTDSDKPVTCWMEVAGNKEYLLSSACDRVFMAPEGFFLVNGLHLGVTFYKGTLDKIGVQAEFTRAGKYKSAVEPMVSTEMSAPFREMMNSMADSLYGYLVDTISVRRGMSADAVRNIIDDPPMTSRGALQAGLIDGLYYRDQLLDDISGLPVLGAALPGVASSDDDDSAPSISAADDDDTAETADLGDDDSAVVVDMGGAERDPRIEPREEGAERIDRISLSSYLEGGGRRSGSDDKVAVVFCEGQITSGASRPGSSMGSDTIAKAIRRARNNDDVAAIVLRVNSPGGSGLASDIIWREAELAQAEGKPVVVSMSDLAASGGYYIAMGADAIVAQPTTLTGSIGVFAGKYSIGGLYDKVGLTTASIKRGEYSDLFAMNRSLGEDGTRKLEEFVEGFYDTFLDKAADGRGTSTDAIHAVAQGRVWTGEQADDIGLVDAMGSLRTAIAIATEKAGIDGDARLLLYPRQPTFWEELLSGGNGPLGAFQAAGGLDRVVLGGLSDDPGPLGAQVRAAQSLLLSAPLLSSGQPALMAPYHLEVH